LDNANAKTIPKNWPRRRILLAVVIVCELINTIVIKTSIGNMLLLPMLFAMVFGLIIYLIPAVKCVKNEQPTLSSTFVVIAINPVPGQGGRHLRRQIDSSGG